MLEIVTPGFSMENPVDPGPTKFMFFNNKGIIKQVNVPIGIGYKYTPDKLGSQVLIK